MCVLGGVYDFSIKFRGKSGCFVDMVLMMVGQKDYV